MAITLTEAQNSRECQGLTVIFRYHVAGSADAIAVKAAVEAGTDQAYESRVRDDANIEISPKWVDTGASDGEWLAEVPYVAPELVSNTADYVTSFDTGGGQQHVTQSLSTIGSYAPPTKTAPNYKGAIGVTKDGVAGCDIVVPVYKWSETHSKANEDVDESYMNVLYGLTGRVNSDTFRSLAPGECLFVGCQGTRRGDGDWEITYSFAASANRTGLVVGDITGIAKKGWEYLWVSYDDAVDGAAHRIVKVPVAAYVEKVYYTGAFSALEI